MQESHVVLINMLLYVSLFVYCYIKYKNNMVSVHYFSDRFDLNTPLFIILMTKNKYIN